MPFSHFRGGLKPPLRRGGGFTVDGFTLNRFTLNRFTVNGFTLNRFTVNGFTLNRFTVNGFTLNRFTVNGFIPPVEALRHARSLKPFRICSCEKRARNSPGICSYKTKDLNYPGINSYKKPGGVGAPLPCLPACNVFVCLFTLNNEVHQRRRTLPGLRENRPGRWCPRSYRLPGRPRVSRLSRQPVRG